MKRPFCHWHGPESHFQVESQPAGPGWVAAGRQRPPGPDSEAAAAAARTRTAAATGLGSGPARAVAETVTITVTVTVRVGPSALAPGRDCRADSDHDQSLESLA